MKVILHELACKEFRDGMLFYDDQESGLGFDFIDEANQGFKQIAKHPKAWPLIYEDIRAYHIKSNVLVSESSIASLRMK